MKYLLLLITIVMISCNSNDNKKANISSAPSVHFDGLYQSGVRTNEATGDKSTSYLRFYEDGSVINVSSSGTAEQVSKWFAKGNENVSQGTYTIHDKNISFTSSGNNVDVQYEGEVVTSVLLQLHTKSSSNNHEADISYSFVKQ